MTTIYKLDDDLKNQVLDNSNKLIFSFDDDFFEYLDNGYVEKSIKSFCAGRIDTDNKDIYVPEYENAKIEVRTKATYNRSFFYCYLQIEYTVTAQEGVIRFKMSYETTDDCFRKNNKDEKTFERSEQTQWIHPGNSEVTYKFDRKPYNSHRRLTDYILNVDYVLHVSGYEGYPNGIRTFNYQTYNSCGDS